VRRAPSLQRRIAFVVSLVLLGAAVTAGFFIRYELMDNDGNPLTLVEYAELLALLAPFAIAAPIAAYSAARWTLRPLARVEQEAGAVSTRNLRQRLGEGRAPQEALGLVRAVNGALDRLAAAYDHERQFTANAAHALRTPLSVLSLRLQRAADDGHIDPGLYDDDIRRLRRVVDQLLAMARIDAPDDEPERSGVDLSKLARSVAAELLPMAEARNRSLEVCAEQPRIADGHEDGIGEVVRNLVENAILHGQGEIRIAVGCSGDQAWIAVSDDGSGPDLAVREATFDRFARGAHSRGTGLGLPIARDAARRMGGDIAWADGSEIRLVLQAAGRTGPGLSRKEDWRARNDSNVRPSDS